MELRQIRLEPRPEPVSSKPGISEGSVLESPEFSSDESSENNLEDIQVGSKEDDVLSFIL